MSDLHPDMTGSGSYRKRALGVHVDGAHTLVGTHLPSFRWPKSVEPWLADDVLSGLGRNASLANTLDGKDRLWRIGDSSEIWLDKALVTSKEKPYPNGGVTLFISRLEVLRSTNTMIEIADGFADRKILDTGMTYVAFPRHVISFWHNL